MQISPKLYTDSRQLCLQVAKNCFSILEKNNVGQGIYNGDTTSIKIETIGSFMDFVLKVLFVTVDTGSGKQIRMWQ